MFDALHAPPALALGGPRRAWATRSPQWAGAEHLANEAYAGAWPQQPAAMCPDSGHTDGIALPCVNFL